MTTAECLGTIQAWIGRRLRYLADRIDYQNAPRITGFTFTFERGKGVAFHGVDIADPMRDRGCPIAYLSESDYDRAHSEAENPL